VSAVEYGAVNYLIKPVVASTVLDAVEKALRMRRFAQLRRKAWEVVHATHAADADRSALEAGFDRALASLWIAFQPIVSARTGAVLGYEALMRSNEPSLPHPGAVLDAASRLGTLPALGRTVRSRAAQSFAGAPDGSLLFVNLHTSDLLDPTLSAADSPLAAIADRVVLEITERESLDQVGDARGRIATLREMGFRIAIDDLGAGYAGLSSFATLEPEIVKLDMTLIRDVDKARTKRRLVRSMVEVAQDLGMLVVAEGVETAAERNVLVELGCDLLQGFLFARPGKGFPSVSW
jgi:EAL domain-containing protein (putative c-di-GMP-specific phosphodiesterase class I)